MSKSKTRRNRKLRRQLGAALKFGWNAKPTHRGKSGRTGGMHSKMLQGAMRGKGAARRAASDHAIQAAAVAVQFDAG